MYCCTCLLSVLIKWIELVMYYFLTSSHVVVVKSGCGCGSGSGSGYGYSRVFYHSFYAFICFIYVFYGLIYVFVLFNTFLSVFIRFSYVLARFYTFSLIFICFSYVFVLFFQKVFQLLFSWKLFFSSHVKYFVVTSEIYLSENLFHMSQKNKKTFFRKGKMVITSYHYP